MQYKLLFPFALFFSAQVFGQANDSLNEQILRPVEVRSLRVSSNAPFAKTDISSKDIEKLNQGQDLPFLLQYTPSAVATSDAGAGVGYTGLRIRGTDGSRINVTLNGIPVNDAESQGAYFVDIPDVASSTATIQLQRGVGTSTNGVGSFGAAISINNLAQMENAGAEANISYGSFNTQRYTLKAGTGMLKNGFQFDVRLSKISSDGFIDRASSDLKSLQFLAGWKASEKTSFHFMVMTGKEKTYQAWNGIPEAKLNGNDSALLVHYNNNLNYLYFTKTDSLNLFQADPRKYNLFTYKNQTDNYQQDYYQFFTDHHFSSCFTGHVGLFFTRGKGYYEEYKPEQNFSAYGLPNFITPSSDTITKTDLIRQLWLDNKYYGGVFSLLYAKNKTNLTFGGAFLRYEGTHYGFVKWAEYGVPEDYRWYLLHAYKNEANAYVKAQRQLGDRVYLFGDVQYRYVAYHIHGFRNNPSLSPMVNYNFINPKLGLSYFLKNNAGERQKLYVSGAMTGKEPNRDDFEASPISLPKAETLYDAEAGYELDRRKWSIAANLYYMYYRNQLILTGQINDVGAYTRTNVPSSYRAGIELQAGWLPLRWLKLWQSTTLSQNKVKKFTEFVDDYDNGGQQQIGHKNTDIAFSPSVISSQLISLMPFQHQIFSIDIYGKYVGAQYLDNTSNAARELHAYETIDLRLNVGIRNRILKEAVFTVALNNVFNKKYQSNGYTYSYFAGGSTVTENFYFPQAGTNFLLGLNIKW